MVTAHGYASPAQAEHFSERNVCHECRVCAFSREGTTDALFVRHCPLVTQTRKSQSGTQNTLYDPTAFSARDHLHATIDTWSGYRQFRDGCGYGCLKGECPLS